MKFAVCVFVIERSGVRTVIVLLAESLAAFVSNVLEITEAVLVMPVPLSMEGAVFTTSVNCADAVAANTSLEQGQFR